MSIENPLWGAPRIHGELLKLGFEVAQSSVAKYMVKRRGPPSRGWRTFLRNHAPDIAAMDLFIAPTIGDGHPGQAYCTSLALAEWLCRTADWVDPARVCRPISERTGHWTKMRRSLTRFSGSEASNHMQS